MAINYIEYIYKICGDYKTTSRNKRDNVFNIMLMGNKAQKLVKELYYEGCIGLIRKKELAKSIIEWSE